MGSLTVSQGNLSFCQTSLSAAAELFTQQNSPPPPHASRTFTEKKSLNSFDLSRCSGERDGTNNPIRGYMWFLKPAPHMTGVILMGAKHHLLIHLTSFTPISCVASRVLTPQEEVQPRLRGTHLLHTTMEYYPANVHIYIYILQ